MARDASAPRRSPVAPPAARPPKRRRWLRWLPWLVVAYLATGLHTVGPNERAVVRRAGRALERLRAPGLHLGLPYGIDRVDRLKVFESQRVGVGVGLAERPLGRRAQPQEAECLTGDRNLLIITAVVQYRIRDPRAYLFRAADVPALVRNAAAAALASVTSAMVVDEVLTVQRAAVQDKVRAATQATLDRYGVGVQVLEVPLETVAPPQEVADAFRDVTSAREDRQRVINEAKGYRNRLLPQARGQARRLLTDAEAYSAEVVEKARGEADRFRRIAAECARNRELTARRLILETMEEVLPRLSVVVLDGAARQGLDLGLIEERK